MNKIKFISLTASIAFATAFTFGCAGSKTGFRDASDEMIIECRSKYEGHFCGVGTGIADSPDAAEEIAENDARGRLAAEIQAIIESEFERDRVVDLGKKANQAAHSRLVTHVKQVVSNSLVRDARTATSEQNGRTMYTKYRTVSASKDEVYKRLSNAISADQALQDTDDAIEFSQKVRDFFDKKQ